MTPGKTSSTQELCGFTRGPFWTEQARRPNLESGHQSLDLVDQPTPGLKHPLVKNSKYSLYTKVGPP